MMKHKHKILAGSVALALAQLSGTAAADVPGLCGDVSVNAFGSSTAATNGFLDVYFTGASAPQNILSAIAGTFLPVRTTVYSKPTGSSAAGADYRGFCGTLTGLPAPYTSLNGKTLRLINRALGGSGYGVYPVALNADINIMSLATADCTSTTASGRQFECGVAGSLYKSDMGVSDIEPKMFKGPYNLEADFPTQLTTAQVNALTTTRTFDTIFGPVATTLVTNVKSDFSRMEIATILSGKKNTWSSLGVTLAGASGNAGDNINVCRRVYGSGTQSSYNWFFNNFPCGVGNVVQGGIASPVGQADGTAPTGGDGSQGNPFILDPTAGPLIIENSTSGDVRACVQNADTGTDYDYSIRGDIGAGVQDVFYRVKWSNVNPAVNAAKWPAVGNLSLDSAAQAGGSTPGTSVAGFPLTAGTNWSFLKINGNAPVMENAANGLHEFVAETTYQYLPAHYTGLTDTANRLNFVKFFTAASSDETRLRTLAAPTVYAFVANPNNKTLAGANNCAWSPTLNWAGLPSCITARWTRSGQSCQPAVAK